MRSGLKLSVASKTRLASALWRTPLCRKRSVAMFQSRHAIEIASEKLTASGLSSCKGAHKPLGPPHAHLGRSADERAKNGSATRHVRQTAEPRAESCPPLIIECTAYCPFFAVSATLIDNPHQAYHNPTALFGQNAEGNYFNLDPEGADTEGSSRRLVCRQAPLARRRAALTFASAPDGGHQSLLAAHLKVASKRTL